MQGSTTLAELKRKPELAGTVRQSVSLKCVLMTGTGIVPEDSFTLAGGDAIRITIDGIGTLENTVA
jgi:2-dehydro-3-deoxy-D-arabinonate dehydratase